MKAIGEFAKIVEPYGFSAAAADVDQPRRSCAAAELTERVAPGLAAGRAPAFASRNANTGRSIPWSDGPDISP